MGRYIVRRGFHACLVLFVVSLVVFFIISLAPGGPAILSDPNLPPEEREIMRRNLGLDDPVHIQYVKWLSQTAQGDFGRSFSQGQPVMHMIADRLPATLILGAVALVLTVVLGITLGTASAMRPGSALDRASSTLAFIGVSIPGFWLGIILILVFSVSLRMLPSGGMYTIGKDFSLVDRMVHLIMPTMVLSVTMLAQVSQYARSSLMTVMRMDYVRTARSKGLSEGVVINRHVLRNGMLPVVTAIGLMLPRLVGGAAITETVFSWPGVGRLAVEAALGRDYPLVMAITIVVSAAVVLSSLLVDAAYVYLDPRVKLE